MVAREVAIERGQPLEHVVVRVLPAPGHPELAIGAVGPWGVRVVNDGLARALGIAPATIDALASLELRQVARQQRAAGAPDPTGFAGDTVILVDEGMATGATARAAVAIARAGGAAKVVVAAAVASPETAERLEREVDALVVPMTPEPFVSVGYWYDRFPDISDGDVRRLLSPRHLLTVA